VIIKGAIKLMVIEKIIPEVHKSCMMASNT